MQQQPHQSSISRNTSELNDLMDVFNDWEFNGAFPFEDVLSSAAEDDHSPRKPRSMDLARSRMEAAAAAAAAAANAPTMTTSTNLVHPPSSTTSTTTKTVTHHNQSSSQDEDMHNPTEVEEEKLRRRENNKNSARNSRKKKKDYMVVLQEHIFALTQEITQLRLQVKLQHQHRLKLQHEEQPPQPPPPHLQRLLPVPSLAWQRMQSRYSFEHLIRVVSPPHVRFLLWMISKRSQALASSSSTTTTSSLPAAAEGPDSYQHQAWFQTWQEVCGLMALSPEQQERISVLFKAKKSTDSHAVEEREKQSFCFHALCKLQSRYQMALDQLQQIRTESNTATMTTRTLFPYSVDTAWQRATEFCLKHAPPDRVMELNVLLVGRVDANRDLSSLQEEIKRIEHLLLVQG